MDLLALNQLIRHGDLDQVRVALRAEPDLLHVRNPGAENIEEWSALHCAARWGQVEIVKDLVALGVEVYAHSDKMNPPVFVAASHRNDCAGPDTAKVVDYFLNEIPDRASGTLGLGVTIHVAVRMGLADIVRRHLELDPLAIHQRGWLGETPLHWACRNGFVEVAILLLDAGAEIEVDEIGCHGGKPLHWASRSQANMVDMLLQRGAQVDARNARRQSEHFGATPLIMNAYQHDFFRPDDPQQEDQRHDASARVAELLIAAGAKLQTRHMGQTALELARSKHNMQLVSMLAEALKSQETRVVNEQRYAPLPCLPPRPADGHKGTFGSVLVVAGSEGMSGAACLAGRSALHGGAGLVSVAVPRSIAHVVAAAHCSYMTIPLDEDSAGRIGDLALPQIEKALQRKTVLAIGPGLGQSEALRTVVQHLFSTCSLPMILDADGLNAFVGEAERLGDFPSEAVRVLTPHAGEFSRLAGLDVSDVLQAREEVAVRFARTHQVVLLLKGPRTIITDGKRIAINSTGSNALATGGSGDVLTGLIAALIAQKMDAFEAVQLGAHLHGLAGESVASELTGRYATSEDLIHHLSHAWKRMESEMSSL